MKRYWTKQHKYTYGDYSTEWCTSMEEAFDEMCFILEDEGVPYDSNKFEYEHDWDNVYESYTDRI